MKKSGMRFQTRLMWAFFFATALVSFAVIQLTSSKVKHTYQRQFNEKFDSQINYLISARDKRSEAHLAIGKTLAESDYIVSLFDESSRDVTQGRSDFMRKLVELAPWIESARPGPRPQGGNSRTKSGGKGNASRFGNSKLRPLLAVMDLEGEIRYLDSQVNQGIAKSRAKNRRASIQDQLELLKRKNTQHIAYLPQRIGKGESVVRDVIVTPVKDPRNNQLLGAFLMSLSTSETSAERLIDRYQEEIEGNHFENAILIDGELFPSRVLGGIRHQHEDQQRDEVKLGDLEAEALLRIETLEGREHGGTFEADLHGEPHYVHFCAINPDSPLATAWQVSAFPMTELKSDLHDLRIKGSGIGLIGLFVGLIAAWVMSRKLAVPIRELSEGTRKVRDGQLEMALLVRSGDEIGELTQSFNEMTADLRQKERYRNLLEKVSDESVAQAMIEGVLNPELGGELKEVSILFCDIRGFTELTESMHPETVIDLLNQHMTALTNVVREHFGVVDKFVGDEIMAVFGGIKNYGNDAANAARCGVKMIEERNRLNHENNTTIPIGIGIATGEVVAGCMGSEDRLNYTVLGARVNLAARLCGAAGKDRS